MNCTITILVPGADYFNEALFITASFSESHVVAVDGLDRDEFRESCLIPIDNTMDEICRMNLQREAAPPCDSYLHCASLCRRNAAAAVGGVASMAMCGDGTVARLSGESYFSILCVREVHSQSDGQSTENKHRYQQTADKNCVRDSDVSFDVIACFLGCSYKVKVK